MDQEIKTIGKMMKQLDELGDEAARTRALAYLVDKFVGKEFAGPLWARVGVHANAEPTR